mmetsp:Transcript_63236/g.164319  ORF Transcript_63236/g.164319 Transcript_63236/m.164319 type:complete len:233 (+) Transcript_63236:304-1002(+)
MTAPFATSLWSCRGVPSSGCSSRRAFSSPTVSAGLTRANLMMLWSGYLTCRVKKCLVSSGERRCRARSTGGGGGAATRVLRACSCWSSSWRRPSSAGAPSCPTLAKSSATCCSSRAARCSVSTLANCGASRRASSSGARASPLGGAADAWASSSRSRPRSSLDWSSSAPSRSSTCAARAARCFSACRCRSAERCASSSSRATCRWSSVSGSSAASAMATGRPRSRAALSPCP